MENLSRTERKKKEKEEKKQKRTNKGVATLGILANFSRVVEFGEKVWTYIENFFN